MEKFIAQDKAYLAGRKEAAAAIGKPDLFETIDQFGLYCGTQTLAKCLAVYELVKQSLPIPGDIVEFGCWHGSNLMTMAKCLKLLQPYSIKEVYGFDSFEGLATFDKKDSMESAPYIGSYKGNEGTLRTFITVYDMERWVHLVKGNALQTIDQFAVENPQVMLSLSYIDFDLYAPCIKALEFTDERLSVGGLIVLDEALSKNWKGEGIALREFLDSRHGNYSMESIGFTRQPTIILKKIK